MRHVDCRRLRLLGSSTAVHSSPAFVDDDALCDLVTVELSSICYDGLHVLGSAFSEAELTKVVDEVRHLICSPARTSNELLRRSLLARASSSVGAVLVVRTVSLFYCCVDKRQRKHAKEVQKAAKTLLEELVMQCTEGIENFTTALLRHSPNVLMTVGWELLLSRLNDLPQGAARVATGVFGALASFTDSVFVRGELLRDVVLRCQSQWAQVENILHLGLSHTHSIVRRATIDFVAPLLLSHLQKREEFVEAIVLGCSDESSWVREKAASKLGKALDECPRAAARITDELLRLCGDADSGPRRKALRWSAAAMRACPRKRDDIADMLLRRCQDGVDYVRQGAIRVLPEATLACPDKRKQFCDVFAKACSSRDQVIRCCAIEAAADALKAWPEMADDLLTLIVRSLKLRSLEIRTAILKHVAELINSFPMLDEILVESLLGVCHGIGSLRVIALKQLASSAKACPQKSDTILLQLLRGAFCRFVHIRCTALRQIPEAIKEMPAWGQKLNSALIGACHSDREEVRTVAKETLEDSLRASQEAAMEFAMRMQERECRARTTDSGSGTTRKRSNASREDPHPAQRRRKNAEMMSSPSSISNVSQRAEQNNSRKRSRRDANEEESRTCRSHTSNSDAFMASCSNSENRSSRYYLRSTPARNGQKFRGA